MKQAELGFEFEDYPLDTPDDVLAIESLDIGQLEPPITLVRDYLGKAQQNALINEAQSYPLTRPQIQVFGRSLASRFGMAIWDVTICIRGYLFAPCLGLSICKNYAINCSEILALAVMGC